MKVANRNRRKAVEKVKRSWYVVESKKGSKKRGLVVIGSEIARFFCPDFYSSVTAVLLVWEF